MLRSVRIRFALWCAMLMGIMPLSLLAGWIRTYDGAGRDKGVDVIPLKDNSSMVLVASSNDTFWLLKLDKNGDSLWTKIYAGSGNSMDTTLDGNFIITGERNDSLLIMKVGSSGEVIWSRTYRAFDETVNGMGFSICSALDGGYIVTGATGLELLYHPGYWNYRLWLLKVDKSGEKEWSHVWRAVQTDDDACDWGQCVRQTKDGGYIVLGNWDAWQAFNNAEAWCIKTDSLGEATWDTTFEGGYAFFGESICETSDGGYMFTGYVISDDSTCTDSLYVIKIDSTGLAQWRKEYPSSYGHWIEPANDGNYVITGSVIPESKDDNDLWLLKINDSGDTTWTRTYGDAYTDIGYRVKQTPDGGFIITGIKESYYDSDLLVIKTNHLGQVVGITEPVTPPSSHGTHQFEIANPIGSQITLKYFDCPNGFAATVYDAGGRRVDELTSPNQSGVLIWGPHQSPGVYFIKANSNLHTQKVILIK